MSESLEGPADMKNQLGLALGRIVLILPGVGVTLLCDDLSVALPNYPAMVDVARAFVIGFGDARP
jgi:hypothetical protein